MRKLIVANWKMNGSLDKIKIDLAAYAKNSLTNSDNIVLSVPYLYLNAAAQLINEYKAKFTLSSQDISIFANYGAYTGEISGLMLKEFDVKYVLIGHSERRTLLNESGSELLSKINNAIINKIIPIFCIGEYKKIRDSNNFLDFIVQQLELLLQVKEQIKELVIAYEPIWSIGTGVVPTLEQIKTVIKLIHAFVQTYLPHVKITVLYGGSVSQSNVFDILSLEQVGGVLVGGASLKVNDFISICSY